MNVGIIGCGYIGQKRAETLKDHHLIVVCDSNTERAIELSGKYNILWTPFWKDVIEDKQVDLIIIATTNNLLSEIALAAVKKGKYVLIEKPAGRNAKEVKKLLKYSNKIKVGFNLRYHESFIKARQIVESGQLGELMFIRAVYGHGGRKGMEKEWRFDKELSGGGELLDQGVHLIDLSRMFLGDFTKVQGNIDTYFWDTKLEDNGFLNLETKDGKRAFLHVSCTEWKNQFDFQIYGTKGKIVINGLGGSYGTEKITLYEMPDDLTLPKITSEEFMKDNSWQKEIDSFMVFIQNKLPILDGNINNAYEALKVAGKVYKK